MKFTTEFLDDVKPIQESILRHGRWTVTKAKVFEYEGRFFLYVYDVGATELQDGEFSYHQEVECREVRPVQKLTTVYEEVK
jgi:hypothetical protein